MRNEHNGSSYLSEEWYRLPSTARIERSSSIFSIDPLQLTSSFSPGRIPILVYVRPSNEALLRARVPGAQDQRGCPSHPLKPRVARAQGRDHRVLCLLYPLPSQKRGSSLLFTARIERPLFYRGGSASKKSTRSPVDSLSAALLDSKILFQVIESPLVFLTGCGKTIVARWKLNGPYL